MTEDPRMLRTAAIRAQDAARAAANLADQLFELADYQEAVLREPDGTRWAPYAGAVPERIEALALIVADVRELTED